jgi:uncharacterized protein (DUF2141 family)
MLKQTLQSALSFFSKRVKIGIRLLLWCVAFPFLLQSILFMSSCAQVVMPSGGKTDTVPPHVRKSVPENGSANFNSKRVEIQFDEFIQLKDLNSQLLISPPMEKQPDVKVKNKTLSIEFQEPLKPNTTYNLNFGSAIADIHESKAAVNFRYVFSTGAFVDSLSVSGTVRNAHTGNPEKAVFVMLYDNAADSTPYLHVPAYFGRTDVNGFYRINNIRAATYRVVALQDANNNYLVNTDEQIGFRTEPLVLQRNDTVNLRLFKEETARQRIRKAYQAGYGKILLAFNKRVEGLKLRPLNCELNATDQVIESNKGGDTITFWYLKPKPDSLLLEVGDKDRIYDTLRYKLITREKMLSQNKGVKPPLVIKTNVNRDRPFDLDAPLIFVPQGPVKNQFDESKMTLTEDTGKVNLFKHGRFRWKEADRNALTQEWRDTTGGLKESRKYHLLVLPGAYKDLFGFTNDTLRMDFKTQEIRNYGTMKLHLHIAQGKYIVQLLDDKDAVMRETVIANGEDVYYEYLQPGTYRLRLIYDTNGNGKWDTGHLLQHRQPEATLYNIQPVTIRGNWDQELDWYVK